MYGEEGPLEHDPFAGGAIARLAATTEEQREILAAASLGDEANTAYNEAVAVSFEGEPDPDRIERALQMVAARHDALRTTFSADLDQQCVSDQSGLVLERVELSGSDHESRESALLRWQNALMRTPMSLVDGPLFRAFWIQREPGRAQLILLAHHAVCDGWSFHVILEELQAIYANGDAVQLPEAPSFADYAEAQQQRGPDNATAAWWHERLSAGAAPTLDLPTDRARRPRRSFSAQATSHRLSAAVVERIEELAATTRSSSVSVVIAAVAALLHRITGDSDLVVGMPVARQAIEDRPQLVGQCVQLLPLRLQIGDSGSFSELVTNTRSAVIDATEHYDFGFGALIRELRLSGDPSRVPLIPVVVNVDQPLASLRFDDAVGTVTGIPRSADAFEIFLNVAPDSEGMTLDATFNEALFDRGTIDAWMQALEQLLLAAARHPADAVDALRLAPAHRRAEASSMVETRGSAVWLDDLRRQATERSDHVAAATDTDTRTYKQLWEQAEELAARLIDEGVRPGDVVGIATARGPQLLVSIAGVHLTGAAHLPLDPAFPPTRLRFMLEDSAATCIVDGDQLPAGTLPEQVTTVGSEDRRQPRSQPVQLPPVKPDQRAYLIYTSGSTGKPKGVQIEHGSLANLLHSVAKRPGLNEGDRLLAVTTTSFDISLLELLAPLTIGATVVVATTADVEDPSALTRLLSEQAVTVMQSTPATWRMLLEFGWTGAPGLRAFSGGERLPEDVATGLLPRVSSLWNLYGPTETTIWSTVAEVYSPETAALVGTPVAETRILILDKVGNELPRCIPGEICIAGAGVAIGYLDRPQLTAERFVDHLEHGRYYRTGDLGRIRADGSLECLGRTDQQVKLRGHRIELGEIDAALTAHVAVQDAAVAVVGETAHEQRLVAHVVTGAGDVPADLGDHLRALLPGYMLPHQAIHTDALPRLPNGKLDRRALEALSLRQQAAPASADGDFADASGETRTIAEAMARVLGAESFGPDLDFFAAGGHSLLAARLVTELNRTLESAMTMRTVFENPTPRQLARAAAESDASSLGATTVKRRSDQSRAPVTRTQERIWYMQQMLKDRPTYNLPSGHRLRGNLDVDALERALRELVHRQAALRTTFERTDGTLRMVVTEDAPDTVLGFDDLTSTPEQDRQALLDDLLEEAIARPFDLASGPLFVAHLYRLDEDQHLLFFMPHHIIWDGWSFDAFYHEIGTIYGAFATGRSHRLPPLAFSFGDFTTWHVARMRSDGVKAETESWRTRLQQFGDMTPLPLDRPRSPAMSGVGATEWIHLAEDQTKELHALAREHGTTMFVVLLAAYTATLHAYAERDRLLIATPLRGREAPGSEAMMGCCNTLLPLPLKVDPDAPWTELIEHVKETATAGFAHSNIMLEDVVNSGRGGNSTLYHALFSFQDARERISRWGALHHEAVHLFQRGATEDLGLWFLEGVGGLTGGMTYNSDVLERDTILALKEMFLQTLSRATKSPSATTASLCDPRDFTRTQAGGEAPVTSDAAPEQVKPRLKQVRDLPDARGHTVYLLAAIWRRYLNVAQVGLEDNFFDMGGDSLLAIRSISEFEEATGTLIDLGAFLRNPTLTGIAEHVAAGSKKLPSAAVQLQHLGDEPPIYCLLGVGVYRHFAASMGTAQPVFGTYVVEENILEGGLEAIRGGAIDLLANAYVDVLKKELRGKKVQLAGLSAGGVVAMEVARKLTEQGFTVVRILLLDTILPHGYQKNWRLAASRLPGKLIKRAKRLLSPTKSDATTATATSRRVSVDRDDRSATMQREYRAVLESEMDDWRRTYVALDCPVILCRAKDTAFWGTDFDFAADYGWGDVLGDKLTVLMTEGTHTDLLRPPNVDRLAARLRESQGT